MKVGDIIQFPALKEVGYKGKTVQSQAIHFSRRYSDKELAKFLEDKTLIAEEIVNGMQMFKIKRD